MSPQHLFDIIPSFHRANLSSDIYISYYTKIRKHRARRIDTIIYANRVDKATSSIIYHIKIEILGYLSSYYLQKAFGPSELLNCKAKYHPYPSYISALLHIKKTPLVKWLFKSRFSFSICRTKQRTTYENEIKISDY